MTLDVVWLGLLGLMIGGWFVLDGANLGLGAALRWTWRTPDDRRLALTALGPFLLGSEVWLVAGIGLLIGVFPALEKDLFNAYYPIVIVVIAAWMSRDAGVWLRSRRRASGWRARWDTVIVLASVALAFAWGLLLGNVVQGVPYGTRPGLGTLVSPYSLLWGVTVVAAFTWHGAVFTALRMPRDRQARAARTARRGTVPVLVSLLGVALATPLAGVPVDRWGAAAVVWSLMVGGTLAAGRWLRAERYAVTYACSAVVAAGLVVAVGIATAPRLLDGIADARTLELLAVVVLPVVPVLLAAQAWMWWTFRHRIGTRSAVFY
ncbi:cytochrome d ubiquinol oxidase subunit II [Actinobacteria bacterium YIM 96077]|uniref:Cytochrome d ubiquinol oxidase subunit II n=1 Tax=Phytoactinopolyspora halophila TaxID=1981511 RepID=A0A329R2G0_9ACTN|nr:cytochrome d ubiquinol oxidase subunit II [Phytoactinopolyspora halophila]AYY12009.1 cytochrome d ubiquinol oxidase subunit II [Actinobacteria bacterium YIM 96077]RAW18757.1 hypothetical protein DPM12_01430 [Phytoactinopolyspora halophila]